MTCAPVVHLAIGLLINNEMNAPPKPMIMAKPSSAPKFKPLAVKKRLTPNKEATTPSTSITARLVTINRKIRFMCSFETDPPVGQMARMVRAIDRNSSPEDGFVRVEIRVFVG